MRVLNYKCTAAITQVQQDVIRHFRTDDLKAVMCRATGRKKAGDSIV